MTGTGHCATATYPGHAPVPHRARRCGGAQHGAAAIEFALLFPIFFAVFYALVSYGLVLTLTQSLTAAAVEGVRAAVRVDRTAYPTETQYMDDGVTPAARSAVAATLAWMPQALKAKVLGDANSAVSVLPNGNEVTVVVQYAGYATDPLIPILVLPGIGAVPRVPADLVGRATGQL